MNPRCNPVKTVASTDKGSPDVRPTLVMMQALRPPALKNKRLIKMIISWKQWCVPLQSQQKELKLNRLHLVVTPLSPERELPNATGDCIHHSRQPQIMPDISPLQQENEWGTPPFWILYVTLSHPCLGVCCS